MPSAGFGYFLIVIAIFFNGSVLLPFKKKSVQDTCLNSLVFQLYCAIGILFSSLLTIPFLSLNPLFVAGSGNILVFVPLGMVAGMILEFAILYSFISAKKIGMALSTGIFGGVSIVVSALWGVVAFNEKPNNPVLFSFGLVFLCAGTVTMAYCESLSEYYPDAYAIQHKGSAITNVNDKKLLDKNSALDVENVNTTTTTTIKNPIANNTIDNNHQKTIKTKNFENSLSEQNQVNILVAMSEQSQQQQQDTNNDVYMNDNNKKLTKLTTNNSRSFSTASLKIFE
jgi:multidrug transporter EmrE-like cation transporter